MKDSNTISIAVIFFMCIAVFICYMHDSAQISIIDNIKQDKVYMKELSERDYHLFAKLIDGKSSASIEGDKDYRAWKAKQELHK